MLASMIIAAGIVSAAYGSFKACKLATWSARSSPRSSDDAIANAEGDAVQAAGAEGVSAADAASAREAMLTLWVVLALFRALESWADYFISALPFYGVLKFAFIVCVMLPHRTATRTFLFAQWVDPTLSRYEQRFTAALRSLRRAACDLVGRVARKALRMALNPAITHLSADELARVSDALSATSKLVKTENTKRLNESVKSLFAAAPVPLSASAPASVAAAAPITGAAAPAPQIEGVAPASAAPSAFVEPGAVTGGAAAVVTASTPRGAISLSSVPEDAVAPAVQALGEADHCKAQLNAVVAAAAAEAAAPAVQKPMDVQRLLQRVKAAAPAPAAPVDVEDKENHNTAETAAHAAVPVAVAVRRSSKRITGTAAAAKPSASAASRAAKLKRQSIL